MHKRRTAIVASALHLQTYVELLQLHRSQQGAPLFDRLHASPFTRHLCIFCLTIIINLSKYTVRLNQHS